MTSERINRGQIGTVALGRCHRLRQATLLVPLVLLGSILTARGAERVPTPLPEHTSTAEAPERLLSLNLDRVLDQDERGHSESDLSLRREIWSDPMVRLAFGIGREEAAARRGGLVGYPVRFTAGGLRAPLPGADLRLVLSGPLAADWHDLSTPEKIGRVAETVVCYAMIFGILRGLHGQPR